MKAEREIPEVTAVMGKTKAKKPGKTPAKGQRHSISTPVQIPGRPSIDWVIENGAPYNAQELGKVLAAWYPDLLFRRAGSRGLYRIVPGQNTPVTVATGAALRSLLVDLVNFRVIKNGKFSSDMLPVATLGTILGTECFLGAFRPVQRIVTSPAYLPDFSLTQPGYNPGGVLYRGPAPAVSESLEFTNKFLDVMEWAGNADRTNAVAAALLVHLRLLWPGGKLVALITATVSGAGKGTVMKFAVGIVRRANVLYENLDWPIQRQLQQQLNAHPDIGVITSDNVRTDSSHSREIRSGFLEGFITEQENILNAPGGGPEVCTPNAFVFFINTNEGVFSKDFLNRSLLIHLAPRGDVTETHRNCPIGDPMEYLDRHREQLDAERRGMIEKWKRAGRPLLPDAPEGHRMVDCTRTLGGILQVNGFTDFLGNHRSVRAVYDPVGQSLGILAAVAPGKEMPAGQWAALAVTQGLDNLFRPGSRGRDKVLSREREMGWTFKRFINHTVEYVSEDGERLRFTLRKDRKRWDNGDPHTRYWFEPADQATKDAVKKLAAGKRAASAASTSGSDPRCVACNVPSLAQTVGENDLGGVVLEEGSPPPESLHRDEINQPRGLEQYEPKTVSQLRPELLADQEVGNDVAEHVAQPDQKDEEGRRA
jgi:hypothetical protein